MKPLWQWIILAAALLLGTLGAVLAAKVNSGLFWAGFVPALGLIVFFICKSDPKPAEPPASSDPQA